MKTILEVIGFVDQEEDLSDLLEIIDDEYIRCRNTGDNLGAGEWLASKLHYLNEDQVEEVFCKIVSFWSSPLELKTSPSNLEELITNIDEFVPEDLATALITALSRLKHASQPIPPTINDIAFRIQKQLISLFELETQRPAKILSSATAKLETLFAELQFIVDSFSHTNCITAKASSIDLIKKAHQLKKIVLIREKPVLSDLDILLGSSFRKFCENCERQETIGIIKRAPDLKEQAHRIVSSSAGRADSVLWNLIVGKTASHVLNLIEEGTRRSKIAVSPSPWVR